MSPGRMDPTRLRRYLVALDDILTRLSEHTGKGVDALSADTNERWAIERGLQLCTQCVLDIATHLVASAGRDAADYASALDELGADRRGPAAWRLEPTLGRGSRVRAEHRYAAFSGRPEARINETCLRHSGAAY